MNSINENEHQLDLKIGDQIIFSRISNDTDSKWEDDLEPFGLGIYTGNIINYFIDINDSIFTICLLNVRKYNIIKHEWEDIYADDPNRIENLNDFGMIYADYMKCANKHLDEIKVNNVDLDLVISEYLLERLL